MNPFSDPSGTWLASGYYISVSLINEDTVEVGYATMLCNCIQLISCQNNDGTFLFKMLVYCARSKCGGI